MCKSDDCIRLYFCIRFEFPLIFTDGFLISGGMGKCHNCKNSLKCVGFMCKNENRILCVFMFDSSFLRFLLLYLRFWTDWKNDLRPRPAAQATQRQQPAQAPSLSAGIPGGNRVETEQKNENERPMAQTSASSQPRRPACQPESRVETGWKLGTKMRMSDPWPRPVPAASPLND